MGKIYNVMAQVLAEEAVEVNLNRGTRLAAVAPHIRHEVQTAFAHIQPFCRALTRGLYAVC